MPLVLSENSLTSKIRSGSGRGHETLRMAWSAGRQRTAPAAEGVRRDDRRRSVDGDGILQGRRLAEPGDDGQDRRRHERAGDRKRSAGRMRAPQAGDRGVTISIHRLVGIHPQKFGLDVGRDHLAPHRGQRARREHQANRKVGSGPAKDLRSSHSVTIGALSACSGPATAGSTSRSG